MQTKLVMIGIIGVSFLSLVVTNSAIADPHPEDHQKEGNNGQCWKLQNELDLGGSKDDCRESFTGKDHNDDDGEPLP